MFQSHLPGFYIVCALVKMNCCLRRVENHTRDYNNVVYNDKQDVFKNNNNLLLVRRASKIDLKENALNAVLSYSCATSVR